MLIKTDLIVLAAGLTLSIHPACSETLKGEVAQYTLRGSQTNLNSSTAQIPVAPQRQLQGRLVEPNNVVKIRALFPEILVIQQTLESIRPLVPAHACACSEGAVGFLWDIRKDNEIVYTDRMSDLASEIHQGDRVLTIDGQDPNRARLGAIGTWANVRILTKKGQDWHFVSQRRPLSLFSNRVDSALLERYGH